MGLVKAEPIAQRYIGRIDQQRWRPPRVDITKGRAMKKNL